MDYSPEQIASACGKPKKTSNGWDCCCPAHEDTHQSLSIKDENGKLILKCHVGCEFEDIISALKNRGLNFNGNIARPIPVHYVYRSADGQPYHRVEKTGSGKGKKLFLQRYENNQWEYGLAKQPQVLYQLPELRAAILAGNRVAIAEGEKDADRVTKETDGKIVCTTNMAGASNWKSSYTQEFIGADVTIFYDNDKTNPEKPNDIPPGIKRRDDLVAALKGVVKKLTIIHLPIEYKDVSDFWNANQEITADMYEVIKLAKSRLASMLDAGEWLENSHYKIEPLIDGLFDCGDKVAIIGKSKTRKSFFALQLLLCCVTEKPFLGFQVPTFRKALLIQYEIKDAHFFGRLERMCESMSILPDQLKGRLSIINARAKNMSHENVMQFIKDAGAEIVLFDPLYKLMEGAENTVEDFKPILAWFDQIAEETGAAVLYVHHDKKGDVGEQALADRGAGSSIVGRDFDASFFITPHENEGLAIVETLTRNYAPKEKQSIEWVNGSYMLSEEVARVKTSRSKQKNPTTMDDWTEPGMNIMREFKELTAIEFEQRLVEKGATGRQATGVRQTLCRQNRVISDFTKGEKSKSVKTLTIVEDTTL